MKKCPLPHTIEWFERLMENNPQQALHTAAIIGAAGRRMYAVFVGGEPVQELRLCRIKISYSSAEYQQ